MDKAVKELVGGKWWKVDFHVHTPASFDYGHGSTDPERDKSATPKDFLLKAIEKKLDCLVISDHNTFEWIEPLREAMKELKSENPNIDEVTIFPAVEVNVSGNYHLLGVFGPDVDRVFLERVFGEFDYDESCCATTKSIKDVMDIIISKKGIAIPAHVDKESGLLYGDYSASAIRSVLNIDELLAFEVIGETIDNPLVKESKKHISFVSGSDSHSLDTLGNRFTWVKMGQPTIEALRLALFDNTDGVIRGDYYEGNPNDLHDRTYIKSIEVSKGKYVGRRAPLNVEFSPWMNSIIGGRGTGKSSIISFLRMTLNKQDELPEPIKKEFDDFAKIPANRKDLGMLTDDTSIKTCIVKQGIEYNLLWEKGNIYEILEGEKYKEVDIQERFPITIFSQKQLFEMTKDAQLLLKHIDRKWNSKEWSIGYSNAKNDFFNYLAKLNINKTKIEEKTRLERSLQELEIKIKAFETEATKKILDQQKELLVAEQQARQIYGKYNNVLSDAKRLISDINEISDEALASDKIDEKSLAEISKWETTIKDFNKTFVDLYEKSADSFLPENDWFSSLDISTALENNRSDIEKVIKELEKSGVDNIGIYPELLQQKDIIEEQLKQYSNTTREQEELQDEREKLLNAFYALVKERIEQRNNVISQWNANSRLKITLLPFGNYERNEDTFRGIINKSSSFIQDILNSDADGHFSGGLLFDLGSSSDPEESINNLKSICASLLDPENSPYSSKFKTHINSLISNDNTFEGRLLTWIPDDQLKLELQIDKKKIISIDASSAGQRTSAMLALLLQNSEEPIIIDQPEDDLDTKIISDLIVFGINEKKKNQQIIIVTHNPNIVVNTNSEQVIHMDYNNGEITSPASGALQNKSIRDAICLVMEGGKDALEKRYYRISKALE